MATPYPPSKLYAAMNPEQLEQHVQMLKGLSDKAIMNGEYITPTYSIHLPTPRHGVPIYCPDGRVLKAHSEADAQALCYDLNTLKEAMFAALTVERK